MMTREEILQVGLQIRRAEELLLEAFRDGHIRGTVHTCLGQELIPVMVNEFFGDAFWFSNHRGHGHYLARTKDFAADFARSLSALNEVILLPIYPAREMPILGVTSDYLLELITNDTKKLISKEELLGCAEAFNSGVFVTIGAGDIDRFVQPIKEVFMHKLVKR